MVIDICLWFDSRYQVFFSVCLFRYTYDLFQIDPLLHVYLTNFYCVLHYVMFMSLVLLFCHCSLLCFLVELNVCSCLF